jgi:hypothetical protein
LKKLSSKRRQQDDSEHAPIIEFDIWEMALPLWLRHPYITNTTPSFEIEWYS